MNKPDNETRESLDALIRDASTFSIKVESTRAHSIRRLARRIAVSLFGKESEYVTQLDVLEFPFVVGGTLPSSDYDKWAKNSVKLVDILFAMQDEIESAKSYSDEVITQVTSGPTSNKIFVVHGHDNMMKQVVARVITQLGLEPIILHEQPNMGRTIIEKFNDYANVDFVVVLLSPDDIGYAKDDSPKNAKMRARQNVVFEFGFFVGKLGRKNVLPLFKKDGEFDMPTDLLGVMYTDFDNTGVWKFALVRELQEAGYNVDANRILNT